MNQSSSSENPKESNFDVMTRTELAIYTVMYALQKTKGTGWTIDQVNDLLDEYDIDTTYSKSQIVKLFFRIDTDAEFAENFVSILDLMVEDVI